MADDADLAVAEIDLAMRHALQNMKIPSKGVAPIMREDGVVCCGMCGEPIPVLRLEAFNAYGGIGTCIECAERLE